MYGLYNLIYNKKLLPMDEWQKIQDEKNKSEVKKIEETESDYSEAVGAASATVGTPGAADNQISDRDRVAHQRPVEDYQSGHQADNDDIRNEVEEKPDDENQPGTVSGAEELHEV